MFVFSKALVDRQRAALKLDYKTTAALKALREKFAASVKNAQNALNARDTTACIAAIDCILSERAA